MDPGTTPAGRTLRDLLLALLIGVGCLAVYNANMRAISAADTYAARTLPFSILRNHAVTLNPILDTVAQGRQPSAVRGQLGSAFWISLGRGNRYVSRYPILLPVVIAPLYLPALAYLDARGWDPHLFDTVARVMEKLVASSIAAASVALLYLLLRRRAPPGLAALLSLAYAFGTTTWVIGSQALWTHGMAQLLIVATMLLVTGRATVPRVAAAGLFCAMIAANRQPDAILAAALGLYGLWWAGRLRPVLIAAGLVPVALTLAYNLMAVGHVAGAYALIVRPSHYNDDIPGGVAGLLFSPARGLFVFSPFLLFVPCLFLAALRARDHRGLTIAVSAAMAVQILLYAMIDWRQGVSWGPRWLTDMLPMMMWVLAPIVAGLARPGRILFGTACAAAVAIQAIGAFSYTGATDTRTLQAQGPDRMRGMWRLSSAAFIGDLRNGLAPRDLLRRIQGNIDLVAVIDAETGAGLARQIDIAGWALADSRTPAGVSVLVDGQPVAGTNTFFTRPDVVQALGESSPAGWRLQIPAASFAPGPHRVAVLVHGSSGEEPRLLRHAGFDLPEDSPESLRDRWLDHQAARAVQRLAERQQPPGHWLTAFTRGPVFEDPRDELNTYLNAVMLDILGPLAVAEPLAGMLARARGFLAGQIEADGLVRYHGRPDAPTIGVLGCAITPDADDTALAWRVAPAADRAALATALDTLRRFRREDGLYRTWLAERAAYRCIDPGRDPNPADLGIQIHVLMLLAQEDPPEARALCAAMMRHADEDALWVYYAQAPLMVALRKPDLHRAGCPLALPEARLRVESPGQEAWMRAALLLRRIEGDAADTAAREEAARLLQRIAAQDFAVLTRAPPLFYHNDMTARVRRFYWSPDLGLALWLRLHHALRCTAQGCVGE